MSHLRIARESPDMAHWRWLGHCIRCGFFPNEPRVIPRYMAQGRRMARSGHFCPWELAEHELGLLLDTVSDTVLPWHWRCVCLDHAWLPLRCLERQATDDARRERCRLLAAQLATLPLLPSLSPSDLEEGHHP